MRCVGVPPRHDYVIESLLTYKLPTQSEPHPAAPLLWPVNLQPNYDLVEYLGLVAFF